MWLPLSRYSPSPKESKEFYLYERDNLEARKAELEEQLRWLNEQLEEEEGKES